MPPLAAGLVLARRVHRGGPATVRWSTRIDLRLAPVAMLADRRPHRRPPSSQPRTPQTAPRADDRVSVRSPQPPDRRISAATERLETRLVRETLRERIEHTVERAVARGRREEPGRTRAPETVAATLPGAAPTSLPAPIFPKLPLHAAPVAAQPPEMPGARPEAPPASVRGDAHQALEGGRPQPLAHPHHLPQLVDAVVGELDRRVRAQRAA